MNKKVEKTEKTKETADSIISKIITLKKKLMGLRMKNFKGEVKNTSEIKKIKKEIARLFTKLKNLE